MIDEKDRRINELEKEVTRLKEEKDKIEKEFEKFKVRHAITVENLKKAMKIKANSKKKLKPLGAPNGHKGYARRIPERIDCIKALILKRCPHCNTKLGKTQEIRHRHVTDIKLVSKTKTTRYDIHRKYCPTCNKIVEPDVPNVLPYARFGLNLMLLVMYLKLGLRLPCNKIHDYLMTLYNLKICEAEIVVILRQLINVFGGYYSYLEEIVKLARVKHTDTTSWRINGKNYFAWVFIASGIVLYKIRKRNNHKVGLAFLGKNQKGNVLVTDRFGALLKLAKKAGFLLQLCWSHILEDSKEIAQNFGAEGKYVHKKLKEIYALAKGLEHKGTDEMVEQLKGEIFQLTQRKYRHLTVGKFARNLYYRDVDNLFRFVTDPNIDPTNNISERELRALVIIRKISYGSRSRRGANATAMLLSIIQTLRFNKENVLNGLQNIVNNPSGW
ncbi:MAG: IS66 family transposase [archaeon]